MLTAWWQLFDTMLVHGWYFCSYAPAPDCGHLVNYAAYGCDCVPVEYSCARTASCCDPPNLGVAHLGGGNSTNYEACHTHQLELLLKAQRSGCSPPEAGYAQGDVMTCMCVSTSQCFATRASRLSTLLSSATARFPAVRLAGGTSLCAHHCFVCRRGRNWFYTIVGAVRSPSSVQWRRSSVAPRMHETLAAGETHDVTDCSLAAAHSCSAWI